MRYKIISVAALILFASCGGPQFKAVEQAPEVAPVTSAPAPDLNASPSGTNEEPSPPTVTWSVLRGLNLASGKGTPALERLDGSTVKIAGYMIPFSDDLESVTEFLLVPAAGLCVHKPAPPANQIVQVQMSSGTAPVDWSTAVAVTGALHIDDSDSPFGKASFRLVATKLEPW